MAAEGRQVMKDWIIRGRTKVEEFIRNGVGVWLKEGRIDQATADDLLGSMDTPEVGQGIVHAGAHFAISLPLRFPFGALARFLYALTLRVKAEAGGIRHHMRPREARRLHTVPVMLISLLPGFGRLAYFFSPALVSQTLLLIIPLDQVSRSLPFKVYERFHLDALYIYWAQQEPTPRGLKRFSRQRMLSGLKSRLSELKPELPWIAAVVAIEGVLFVIGTYIYLESGRESIWWFDERGVIATIDVAQLLIAGVAGIYAYQSFWRLPARPSKSEAYGIFLWGIGGIGLLIFAFEDFFTVHERLGLLLDRLLPGGTNSKDDILVLGYAVIGVTVLYVFHTELVANRASSALLLGAALAAIVMILCDAFAHALALKALELPAQTLADTLLMFAFVTRYREVRALANESQTAIETCVTVTR
ncbi:MAG: hypothetical protein AB7T32_02550 [Dehalococcoidia bacterium]